MKMMKWMILTSFEKLPFSHTSFIKRRISLYCESCFVTWGKQFSLFSNKKYRASSLQYLIYYTLINCSLCLLLPKFMSQKFRQLTFQKLRPPNRGLHTNIQHHYHYYQYQINFLASTTANICISNASHTFVSYVFVEQIMMGWHLKTWFLYKK